VRWQVIGLAVVGVALWVWLPASSGALKLPLAIVLFAFVGLYPLRVATAIAQGRQDVAFLGTAQLFGWMVGTIVTVGLLLAGSGLFAVAAGWVVASAIPALAVARRVARRWPQAEDVIALPSANSYFGRSVWVSVSQIAQVLLAGSDVLIVGHVLGAMAVVPYVCTGKLVTVFANHPQLLMHVSQPALSELRGSGSKNRLRVVATALTGAMLMMSGLVAIAVLAGNRAFVEFWVGRALFGGWPLTFAFVVMMLLRHWNVATVYTLFCFGYERQLALTALADGLVTALGALVLVRYVGPIGAPLASIFGVAVMSLPLNLRSTAKELGVSVREVVGSIAPLLSRTVAVGAATAAVVLWMHDARLLPASLVLIVAAAIYGAVVIPLAWNGPVGPYLRAGLARLGFGSRRPAESTGEGLIDVVATLADPSRALNAE
jgi:O-antigen/teichoic acid export membrane protein